MGLGDRVGRRSAQAAVTRWLDVYRSDAEPGGALSDNLAGGAEQLAFSSRLRLGATLANSRRGGWRSDLFVVMQNRHP